MYTQPTFFILIHCQKKGYFEIAKTSNDVTFSVEDVTHRWGERLDSVEGCGIDGALERETYFFSQSPYFDIL